MNLNKYMKTSYIHLLAALLLYKTLTVHVILGIPNPIVTKHKHLSLF